jgi:amino acid transporter
MALAALLLTLPLALDGESSNSGNTAIGVISVVSIVFGYLLLAALWYFVFRGKAREKRRKRPSAD